MQISEVILARTVWFVDVQKLNPTGLAYGPMYNALKERYKFLRYPSVPDDFDLAKGMQFGGGEFTFEGKKIGVGITIYHNGWAADSLVSTEVSSAFLEDISRSLKESIGILSAKDFVTRTVYESQLVLQCELNLDKLSEKLQVFGGLVAAASGNPMEHVSGFTFGSGTYPYGTFSVERRVNVAFSEGQFYSRAYVPTAMHIHLLEELEKILS